MSSGFKSRRADEKVGRILGRVRAIRVRINSLAWQYLLFSCFALAIISAAVVLFAAVSLSPLRFLAAGGAVVCVAITGMLYVVQRGWRMRMNQSQAAAAADARANLKGRLETIVQIEQRSHVVSIAGEDDAPLLLPYLIEDTLARADDFEAGRIEGGRISKSIWPFLASVGVSLLLAPLIMRGIRNGPPNTDSVPSDITMRLNELHLRPADPGSDADIEVQTDAGTMRRIEQKMAADNGQAGQGRESSGNMDKMLDSAREFAGKLQRKLAGGEKQKALINLKLTDEGEDQNSLDRPRNAPLPDANHREDEPARFKREQGNRADDSNQLPLAHNQESSNSDADSGDAQTTTHPSENSGASSGDSSMKDSTLSANEQSGSGGASHGIGADPDTLFGPGGGSKLGNQGFEIAIEARQMTEGAKSAGHAYLPPKVRTPLSQTQSPDEPIARASIPADDRAAIKKVFER
ncbi:MAG TPA: hypothetical protein VEF03_01460 [Candidatus Binataceae bacterium]|nr:hypothetical protein [Candidatus Binataceae bacterium]